MQFLSVWGGFSDLVIYSCCYGHTNLFCAGLGWRAKSNQATSLFEFTIQFLRHIHSVHCVWWCWPVSTRVYTYFCCASSVSGVIPGCFPKKKLDHQWPESCLGSPVKAQHTFEVFYLRNTVVSTFTWRYKESNYCVSQITDPEVKLHKKTLSPRGSRPMKGPDQALTAAQLGCTCKGAECPRYI